MLIALVYLGPKTPKYVFKNLLHIKNHFPKQDLVFISDSVKSLKKCSKLGINAWLFQDDIKESEKLKKHSSLPMDFRNGFWYSTTARFFALEAFLAENPNSQVIQFESDVWLAPNFPFSKFEELDRNIDIAFPLETEFTGAASVLYIRDAHAAKAFCFETRKIMLNQENATDMTILGQLYKESFVKCLILPSLPPHSPGINPGVKQEIEQLITAGTDYFGGVFDAVTYGLYLMGEDPRNHRGKLVRFRRQEGHLVHCDKLKFECDPDSIRIINQESTPLFNIHIHSKSQIAWTVRFMNGVLPNIIRESHQGVSSKRNYPLTFILAFKSLKRRIGLGV